jgi:glycosyltransferase involved in cell wall biosynthesis
MSSRSMELLFVSDVSPDPTMRGNQNRTARMIEAYQDLGFSIDFLLLNRDGKKDQVEKRLQAKFPRVKFYITQHPRHQAGSPAQIFRYFTKLYDGIGTRRWNVRSIDTSPIQFDKRFSRAIREKNYALVHVNYLRVTPFSLNQFKGLKIVDLHDVITIRFERKVERMAAAKREVAVSAHLKNELFLISQYDRAICITDDDRNYFSFQGIESKKLSALPAFFHLPELVTDESQSYELLYVASDVGLNVESLEWFIREVFPIVSCHLPALSLTIVGRICSVESVAKLVSECPHKENIRALGYVDDISYVYAQASIVIAPMVFGTGMNIKVAEALSYGKAIVGTNSAFRGIKITNREHALVADEPQEFAKAICQLMDNPEMRNRIAKNGKEVFLRDHSFPGGVSKLKSMVDFALSLG